MDWDSIWGQVKEGASNAWEQAQSVGIPVVKAAAEKEIIKVLTKQNQVTTQQANTAISGVLQQQGNSEFGGVVKKAIFEEYKIQIICGVVGLVVVGFVLARK